MKHAIVSAATTLACHLASDEFTGDGTVVNFGVSRVCRAHRHCSVPNDYLRLHLLPEDEEGPFEVRLAKVRWAEPADSGWSSWLFSLAMTVRRLFQAFEKENSL